MRGARVTLVGAAVAVVLLCLPAGALGGSSYPPPPVDTNPPETVITKGPRGKIRTSRATFRFVADEVGSSYECKLDRKRWLACTSPARLTKLRRGKHTFRVRATDQAGNVGKAASRTFRVAKRKR